jgi:hypothetical protein
MRRWLRDSSKLEFVAGIGWTARYCVEGLAEGTFARSGGTIAEELLCFLGSTDMLRHGCRDPVFNGYAQLFSLAASGSDDVFRQLD